MHKDYLRHFEPEREAQPKERSCPDAEGWQSHLQVDLANETATRWRKRAILTILASFLIVSAQATWYYTHPKYVGIPIRTEEPYVETADLEAHIEEKFLQMANVLRYLVDEVKKHDAALASKPVASSALPNRSKRTLATLDTSYDRYKKSPTFIKATVTTSKANVRPVPNLDSEPIMTLDKGTELLVDLRQDDWNRVVTPTGRKAWVSSKVMEFDDAL